MDGESSYFFYFIADIFIDLIASKTNKTKQKTKAKPKIKQNKTKQNKNKKNKKANKQKKKKKKTVRALSRGSLNRLSFFFHFTRGSVSSTACSLSQSWVLPQMLAQGYNNKFKYSLGECAFSAVTQL